MGPPRRLVTATVSVLLALSLLTLAAPAAPARPSSPTAGTARDIDRGPGRDFPELPRSCRPQGATKICRVTTYPHRPWLVLWGDSHALQYLAPLRYAARTRHLNLVAIYAGSCPLSLPFPPSSGERRLTCDQHNVEALDYVTGLARSGRTVRLVLGSWWHYYRTQYAKIVRERATGEPSGLTSYERHVAKLGAVRSRAMFRAIGRAGIPADVLAQSGTVPAHAPRCARGDLPYLCDLDRKRVLPRALDNRRWLRSLSAVLSQPPRVIDTSSAYCDATTCHGRVRGITTFYDDAHLGQSLTRTMRPWFRPTVRALLRTRAGTGGR